ncbi:uncharacterized protein LOC26536210 [Drosophila yakuba]|uniref:Uncharacterized protein n=1 Tax=Drosophila yakuba TaxID=7245 RepID=B4IUP0_DROYA|nr:uncharacterized protein LOC26536210 [Drosophila yakuba]EDX00104.1 uncharacterized protein Dyak_GE22703 [Drosophila yakuba]KRK02490.1 uncharacterized protein Dyak_GE29029 [Drosophila yakuba]
MSLYFTFLGISILFLAHFFKIRAIHSTGNCNFAINVPFRYVCKGNVSEDMSTMFRDHRAPADTPYSVWQSKEDDSTLLVSFYTIMFTDFDTIELQAGGKDLGRSFLATNETNEYIIFVKPSTLHCFSFGLRYTNELRRHCLGQNISEGGDITKKPILHYAAINVESSDLQKNDASTTSLLGKLLLSVCAVIIY